MALAQLSSASLIGVLKNRAPPNRFSSRVPQKARNGPVCHMINTWSTRKVEKVIQWPFTITVDSGNWETIFIKCLLRSTFIFLAVVLVDEGSSEQPASPQQSANLADGFHYLLQPKPAH